MARDGRRDVKVGHGNQGIGEPVDAAFAPGDGQPPLAVQGVHLRREGRL
jgi:hypothetical protein